MQTADRLEHTWDRKAIKELNDVVSKTLADMERGMDPRPVAAEAIEELFIEHYFDVAQSAVKSAQTEDDLERRHRLAKPPKPVIPKTLAEIRKSYDEWRRGRSRPRRPSVLGEQVKKEYLKKVQQVWGKYSEAFRTGDVASQEEARERIKDAARVAKARAQTIVRTETTNYYNQAREKYYNESPDVTHYLFLAIRDSRTSQWCKPALTNGKRGRHGLVYAKGDPLLAKERPACHPNCRSEILPLTPDNASHLRLISDESIARRNVACYPLLPGWRAG